MFKKIFWVFTVLILFTGCVNKHNETIIQFSSWGSKSEIAILKPILKKFEHQNPDIKVKFIHNPKNYFQKLHLLVASNLVPDVVFVNNFNGPVYAQNDIFIDLKKYLKNDEFISEKDFFENSLKAFKYKNKLYAIPRDVSNLVIYYNKDIFDKYGVEYPCVNWNFQEFLTKAQKLTKDFNKDGRIDLFGFGFEENPLFWKPFLWSNGGGIISDDLKKSIISKLESIESIQFYSDLRNKYHVSPSKSEAGSATMSQFFMQERLAMQINGRWSVPRFRKNIKFNWDITAFPRGEKGSIVDADSSGWAISKSCKNKDAAWKLVRFLASEESSIEFAKQGLIVPARIDVANSQYFLDNKKPNNAKIFIDVIGNAKPTPANKNYQEIMDIVKTFLEPVWSGEKSAKQVIDKNLDKKINKLLEY